MYATIGWRVIPVGSPTMKGGGKTPLLKDWTNQATTDPQTISEWWRLYPDANVGVATGQASGIVVIDIDVDKGGDDSLYDLEQQYGKLPYTTESLTGGGGRHLFFKYPAGVTVRNSVGKLGPGIDVRSDGGQVVLPPSIHKSGNAYEWEASSHPVDLEPRPLPQWLVDLVSEPAQPPPPQQTTPNQVPDQVVKGERNNLLASLAGGLRAKGIDAAEILVLLQTVNQNRCVPPLQDDELDKIAKSIGRYAPKKTRVPTDDELMDAWIKENPDIVYGMGDFRKYSGGIWAKVPDLDIERSVLALMRKHKRWGLKPTATKMNSVITFITAETSVPDNLWNADYELLVCGNGTLHIPTRTLREHRREDYLTSKVDYDYDPLATCPTWTFYLKTLLNDISDFLCEFAGLTLVTTCKYETAIWLCGPAGSGKSTFIEGLVSMLGSKVGILGLADLEQSNFALEGFQDKTLLVSTEQPAKFMKVEHTVNAIVSGEMVKVNRKYKTALTVRSYAKILWAMNEIPRVPTKDSGLFRRIKIVKFEGIPPGVADPNVKEDIKGEGPGILNWSLDGLQRLLQRDRFIIPDSVQAAVEDFKMQSDIPAIFIEEECEVDPSYDVRAGVLYRRYRDWCDDNGHNPQSSTTLAHDWERMGFKKEKRLDANYWVGVRIKNTGVPIP